ncbi:YnfA family protein [Bacillus solitudinis]|uniref:YnfA family protein n=1 Tax=Bacillus solitudinis TaxID=2014074 RepID=UPI000C245A41|nr:YnfA family protein [Bacillus solitudinis]
MAFLLFLLAGLGEIGGGYLIWIWVREGKSFLVGMTGALLLVFYGIIITFQQFPNFGRVYAAYGGLFIMMALLWGWLIDKKAPDFYDLLGGVICVVGACIILFAPRD